MAAGVPGDAEAVPVGMGTMAAILGLDLASVAAGGVPAGAVALAAPKGVDANPGCG